MILIAKTGSRLFTTALALALSLGCSSRATAPGSVEGVEPLAASASALCTAPTLTSDLPSPQFFGTTVNLTATTSCSTGTSAEYRFWNRRDGVWHVLQEWNAANTFAWHTTGVDTGDDTLAVEVRTAGSSAWESIAFLPYRVLFEQCFALEPTTDLPSPQTAGTTVTITGAASCSGPAPIVEYQFMQLVTQEEGTVPVTVRDWDPNPNYVWDTTGLAPGTYTFFVATSRIGAHLPGSYVTLDFTVE